MSTKVGQRVALGPQQLVFAKAGDEEGAKHDHDCADDGIDCLQELQDVSHLYHAKDREGLLNILDDLGYLFIRGLHDRQEVLDARIAVLKHLKEQDALDPEKDLEVGMLRERCGIGCVPGMEGRNPISHSEQVLKVLEGTRIKCFFDFLFGEPCKTFDYKWLRAVHTNAFTGAHVDNVYMSRGTKKLYTCWTPFGDVDTKMGTLAMCEGSHKLPAFEKFQETYGNLDVEAANLNGSGWFTEDPFEITKQFGGQWKTADFRAGDVIVFGMRTVHMSTRNTTGLARVSCDTRWLAASEKPDPRYVGSTFGHGGKKFGAHASLASNQGEKEVRPTMEELKTKWGFPLCNDVGDNWLQG